MSSNQETKTYLLGHLMNNRTGLSPDNPQAVQVVIARLRRSVDRWAAKLDASKIDAKK